MSLPEALFTRYFTVGLQGALMAVLVICLRAAAKRRVPRRLWPALWCVAALRLLVPVRFTGAWGTLAVPCRGRPGRRAGGAGCAGPAVGTALAGGRLRPGHLFSGSVCGGALAAAKRRALCLRAGAGLFSGMAGAPPASGENGRLRYALHLWGAAPGGGAACGKQMAGAAAFLCAGARAHAYRAL